MTQMLPRSVRVIPAVVVAMTAHLLLLPAPAAAQNAATRYERALAREQSARRGQADPAALRSIATAYEQIVRRFPTSGYCDNALWQAAGVMILAYDRSGSAADRTKAETYLTWLRREYPHSKLISDVPGRLAQLAPRRAPAPPAPASGLGTLRRITRAALPQGDRIVIEFTREVRYTGDRVSGPDRVYFDFAGSQPTEELARQTASLDGRLLQGIRIGTHPDDVTRVVLELDGSPEYSAFPMYEPFRLVIDLESDALEPIDVPVESAPLPAMPAARVPVPPASPIAPSETSAGDYSLARQLGLGVSRIVIDAGHGGHDPGARAHGVTESALVLDISRRVADLLKAQPGFDVVLTRSDNVYIPLEERTAIANREDADLFLSIHANASPRPATRGIETYYLNFARNPEAEAVAARENASSSQTMGGLTALVNQIALTNKLDESRELATIVQTSIVRRLRTVNAGVKDLGVKQAPFVVLIGAQMPSVLAEISFLTHRNEAELLKQDSYRQRIAEALADAVIKYQASLKKVTTQPDDIRDWR